MATSSLIRMGFRPSRSARRFVVSAVACYSPYSTLDELAVE